MKTKHWVTLLALLLIAPTSVQAQMLITTDTTQDGGTFVAASPVGTVTVSDPANDPLLTLTSGAQTSGISLVTVGLLDGETGRLLVEQGSTLSTLYGAILGDVSGSSGTATITGNDSVLQNTGVLIVGNYGTGMLNVEDGGFISSVDGSLGSSPESNGTATVSGIGSRWLNDGDLTVGSFGTGKLTIEDGGIVNSFRGNLGFKDGSTGRVIVSGSGSQWINSFLFIGQDAGTGTLTIDNGGNVTTGICVIGNGGDGTVTVTGIGSEWQCGKINVGAGGTGTLIIENGGSVLGTGSIGSSPTASSSVTVNGAGSIWQSDGYITVGDFGTGKLIIENGGLVTSSGGTVGQNGSSGTVIVNGAESQWQNDSATGPWGLAVGDGGTGKLIIENGALVTSRSGMVGGYDGNGNATITGPGSRWKNSGDLTVGRAGNGTLIIENGGFANSGSTYLGVYKTSLGTATVTDTDSHWQNNYLTVGGSFAGTGKLTIENGGLVTTSQVASIGFGDGSTGTVIVNGEESQWRVNGELFVADGGIGKLTIEDGGVVEVGGSVTVGAKGTLAGNGGTIIGDVVSNGLISPGNSPGILTIDGDLTSNGIVKFELAGSGLFDQLLVSGDLDLGGVLEIDLLDGFTPTANSHFKLLNFGSLNDIGYRFDFSQASLNRGLTWDTSTFEVDGTIRVVPEASSIILAGMGALAGLVCWRTKSRST